MAKTARKEMNGWLSPDAKFISCEYGKHDKFIEDYLGLSINIIEKMGWQKINQSKGSGWSYYGSREPNFEQKEWINRKLREWRK